ncbi:uncharacterized protein B0H18DRAFT_99559 [Fomitopsis serialis]|uniref:uncharacterized protein n=1 Tax=Fomitopsis serialis TaxID=139415 RepID=UPI0020083EA0|nr:uncharacterized protein B0H18DRAFT_99559 [Neoantrodia serialis]KAH9915335.1 hypothetical protein B0H18DRAFT_99559 [Neoantrodia serialis]
MRQRWHSHILFPFRALRIPAVSHWAHTFLHALRIDDTAIATTTPYDLTMSPTYSERFNAADADLTISSSDGVLFKVHRKSLETYSDIFPGTDVPVDNEIVPLSEKASTLDLLFQYMYRQRQPDLSKIDADELAMLAEAAEKYFVYSAMEVCKVYMQSAIPKMPLKVMGYAARHEYESLCEEAAPHTVQAKAADALEYLDARCFASWVGGFGSHDTSTATHRTSSQVLYREHWLQVLYDIHHPPFAPLLHKGGLPECPLWLPFQGGVLQDLGSSLACLQQSASATVDRHRHLLGECVQCKKRADHWVYAIAGKVASIPKFDPTLRVFT